MTEVWLRKTERQDMGREGKGSIDSVIHPILKTSKVVSMGSIVRVLKR